MYFCIIRFEGKISDLIDSKSGGPSPPLQKVGVQTQYSPYNYAYAHSDWDSLSTSVQRPHPSLFKGSFTSNALRCGATICHTVQTWTANVKLCRPTRYTYI